MSDTIEDRVARGAAILDEKRPGWFDEIKLPTLRMSDCERCVIGQFFGDFAGGLDLLCPVTPDGDGDYWEAQVDWATDHGFETSDGWSEYDELGVAWHAEVMKRRNGGES